MSQSSLHVALVVVAIVVALGGAWVMHRRASSNVVVLGQELADANAVEKERLARGPGPSPLANKSYDQTKEGHSLFRVDSTELDETIRGLLAEFAAGSSQTRTQLTSLLSMDDLYTLLHFSKRSAVFALRERSPERCYEGMTALAAVDIRRLDPRDLDWAAAVVDSVATLIAADWSSPDEVSSRLSASLVVLRSPVASSTPRPFKTLFEGVVATQTLQGDEREHLLQMPSPMPTTKSVPTSNPPPSPFSSALLDGPSRESIGNLSR